MRSFLIVLAILTKAALAHSQQNTAKNLIGRWQNARAIQNNIAFFTDSTGAFLAADGFLYNKMNYSTKVKKDVIELKYTVDVNRKRPSYVRPYIKFLNDSTFLMRFGWEIPEDADTTSKKVAVYTKIKNELPGNAVRYPRYTDILGVWKSRMKDTTKFQKFTFVDSSTLYIQTSTQGLHKLKYVADLKTQPITIDVFHENKLVKQMFLAFYGRDVIRVGFFDPNKRGDHFTMFGGNAHLYRDKKADPSLYR